MQSIQVEEEQAKQRRKKKPRNQPSKQFKASKEYSSRTRNGEGVIYMFLTFCPLYTDMKNHVVCLVDFPVSLQRM